LPFKEFLESPGGPGFVNLYHFLIFGIQNLATLIVISNSPN
jgi:hypothetical protein